jgi:hypothetical protein
MATSMHRIQLSLREEQAAYLAERARRDGISQAEVVRRLLDEEAAEDRPSEAGGIWSIVGLVRGEVALIDDVPVSEAPDRYIYGLPGEPAQPDESSAGADIEDPTER